MIKALLGTPEGVVLMLGLARANIDRLMCDQPILIEKAELDYLLDAAGGRPLAGIVLLADENEEAIMSSFRRQGFLRPDTVVHDSR